jgi:8-oxo-dGTP pyrophosphatase MutT (NUDIX family)
MANQELYNKQYQIPQDILKSIEVAKVSASNGNGLKRANFILKNGMLTYQAMKRLKHDFDTNNFTDKSQYILAGGDAMRNFINVTLNADRDGVETSKEVRRDIHTNPNSELRAYQTPRLSEADKKEKKELQKNAVAVIVDSDNKFLLLKRGNIKGGWGNNQYGLVGGAIEKGETPQKAIEREIFEETGLVIDKFIKTFTIQRNVDSIEHVFACRYNGEPTDIELNDEHTNYGWYDISEIEFLDAVPNLTEYIILSFTEY